MGLLNTTDLPQGPLTPEQALERAEALIAHYLCPDLPDLGLHQWEVPYRHGNQARPYGTPVFGTRRIGPEVLKRWPVTGLTAVLVGQVDVTDQCAFDLFSVRRDTLQPEFSPLDTITIRFQTGWATAADVPPVIRQAVALTMQGILEAPAAGIIREKLGDAETQYAADVHNPLPGGVTELLRAWRFEGF